MSFEMLETFQIFLSAFKVSISTREDTLKSKIQFKGKETNSNRGQWVIETGKSRDHA